MISAGAAAGRMGAARGGVGETAEVPIVGVIGLALVRVGSVIGPACATVVGAGLGSVTGFTTNASCSDDVLVAGPPSSVASGPLALRLRGALALAWAMSTFSVASTVVVTFPSDEPLNHSRSVASRPM
jgi:hypothetical protein